MPLTPRPCHDLSVEELATLDDRLYAFNASAIGRDDAQPVAFTVADEAGEIIAAATGHSWAGTAELKLLWVAQTCRGQGLGTALLEAFIDEARLRAARRIWVSSHGFQAPALYERAGFIRMATFADWPEGHTNIVLCKTL